MVTNNGEPQISGYWHRDVLVDHLTELNARVEARGDDVHRQVADDEIELHMRVLREKPAGSDSPIIVSATVDACRPAFNTF